MVEEIVKKQYKCQVCGTDYFETLERARECEERPVEKMQFHNCDPWEVGDLVLTGIDHRSAVLNIFGTKIVYARIVGTYTEGHTIYPLMRYMDEFFQNERAGNRKYDPSTRFMRIANRALVEIEQWLKQVATRPITPPAAKEEKKTKKSKKMKGGE